jgi:hypothetical protein
MHTVRSADQAPLACADTDVALERRAASESGFLLLAREPQFERGDSLTKLLRRVADLIEEVPGGRQVAFFDLQ